MLRNQPFEQFRGLRLIQDEQELNGVYAGNLLNVELDYDGRVRTRDGVTQFNQSTLSSVGYNSIWPSRLNGGEMIVQRADTNTIYIDALDQLGFISAVDNWTATGNNGAGVITSAAHFGTPLASYIYFASHDGTTQLVVQKYDGTSTNNGTGEPRFVAVSPRSNRLVQAHFTGATDSPSGANGSPSTVFFSDEGAPDTFTATNFVVLRPGDGEEIVAMVNFRDDLIVFKQTVMYVFYGESVDDEGLVEFNYREESLGTALTNVASYRSVVVGSDAVYFSTADGIYRTTGGPPQLISQEISPIFSDTEELFLPADMLPGNGPLFQLDWSRNQLLATYLLADATARTLAWSPENTQWVLWQFDPTTLNRIVGAADWPTESSGGSVYSDSAYLIFFSTGGDVNDVFRLNPGASTDDGAAIDWFYESSYYRLGGPGEKMIRYTDVYGTGTVTASVLGRGGRSGADTDSGTSLSLGTAPVPARARRAGAVRARMFAHRLSGTGRASVNSLEHYYADGASV